MKFSSINSLLALLAVPALAQDEETNSETGTKWYTGEQINTYLHDGSVFNETSAVYDGTCGEQANCLGMTVHEVQRRCGSGSCEYYVCYFTEMGQIAADVYTAEYSRVFDFSTYNFAESDAAAAQATVDLCKLHPDYGVDYAGNMNTDSPDEDTGGCINAANSKGKGFWDDTCINPEVADADTGVTQHSDARFSTFCQVVAPGHTVHFMMHSYNRLNWNGLSPESVTCSGSAEIYASSEPDKYGTSKCAPSSSLGSNPNGQTYFPATDGSAGGTCSDQPEAAECVWSYTAPNECKYEENDPTCAITQASVDTVTTLCGPDYPVVEYFEHPDNPNGAPPRIPLHNIQQNGDGTVTFQIYNPYGNYSEPIDYSEGSPTADDYKYGPGGAYDLTDLYVVYHQANEIGNEVCDLETATGKCPSDNAYTAKCRTDGVSVVTVFASGFDAESAAAQQVAGGEGSYPFGCCPDTYQPQAHFNPTTTAAWTFLVHCDCPTDSGRRQLREDASAKFQKGEYFTEDQKNLHKLL